MDRASQAYPGKPDSPESCQVNGPGCLEHPAFQIFCRIEGRTLRACQPCYVAWQDRAHRYGLHDRCPLCANLARPLQATPHVPAPPVPLMGPAADAINGAMHLEGLTVDIRQKVLARLRLNAPWLEAAGLDTWVNS